MQILVVCRKNFQRPYFLPKKIFLMNFNIFNLCLPSFDIKLYFFYLFNQLIHLFPAYFAFQNSPKINGARIDYANPFSLAVSSDYFCIVSSLKIKIIIIYGDEIRLHNKENQVFLYQSFLYNGA